MGQIKAIAKKHNLKVDFVDYGIASRIGNTIIMNKNILKYPNYCHKVFNHELSHTPNCTKKDLLMDMFEGSLFDNLTFCIKHPRAFSYFIPLGKYKGNYFIDVNMILIYILGISAVIFFFTIF